MVVLEVSYMVRIRKYFTNLYSVTSLQSIGLLIAVAALIYLSGDRMWQHITLDRIYDALNKVAENSWIRKAHTQTKCSN